MKKIFIALSSLALMVGMAGNRYAISEALDRTKKGK